MAIGTDDHDILRSLSDALHSRSIAHVMDNQLNLIAAGQTHGAVIDESAKLSARVAP